MLPQGVAGDAANHHQSAQSAQYRKWQRGLVIGMKVWLMVWRTSFNIHADDNSEESE